MKTMQRDKASDGWVREGVANCRSAEEAIEFVRQVLNVQHATFHLAHTVIGCVDVPYVKSTYPAEWLTRYLLKGYLRVDPVVMEGFSRRCPFDWSELEMTPEAHDLMADAVAHRVGSHGYSVPLVDRENRRSLFSITSSAPPTTWVKFLRRNSILLTEIGQLIHSKAIDEVYGRNCHIPHLSPREIECLSLTAQGKSNGVISSVLDLSENTVRAYLKSVRHKLDCSNITEAVAKAIRFRIISP